MIEEMRFDAKKQAEDCIQWIRNWFEENGKDSTAIIGISGGKDSTVVAKLCVEALGDNRVFGVLMPDGEQADLEDSFKVCRVLDIPFTVVNIAGITNKFFEALWKDCPVFKESPQMEQNLPPRVRMTVLYAIAQGEGINGRVANTCNLSETMIGWETRWGDAVGDFAPLANFTATEVMQIGDALGLPNELVHKTPSDGLCGKSDEDKFGFTYAVLDTYLRTGECENADIKEKIDRMIKNSEFKRNPIASYSFVRETHHAKTV